MYSCGTSENTLYELLQNCNAYDGLKAQKTLKTRYILEDVPRILKKNQKKSKKFLDILIR